MPTVAHSTLTTTDLHEPKGASTATDNSVMFADGSGSTKWKVVAVAQLVAATATETNNVAYSPIVKVTPVFTFGSGGIMTQDSNFGIAYASSDIRVMHVRWGGSVEQDQAGTKTVFIAPSLNGTVLTQYEQKISCAQNEKKPFGGSFIIQINNLDIITLEAFDADAAHILTFTAPYLTMTSVGGTL